MLQREDKDILYKQYRLCESRKLSLHIELGFSCLFHDIKSWGPLNHIERGTCVSHTMTLQNREMSTFNRLESGTLRSRPIMPKKSPRDTDTRDQEISEGVEIVATHPNIKIIKNIMPVRTLSIHHRLRN